MDNLQVIGPARRVLITGGAGYIGSHTAVELIEAGYDVVLVDNLSNSERVAVEGVRRITGVDVPFEEVDCNDFDAFGGVFRRWKFDAAIHFAAFKAVDESIAEPLKYYRNNLGSFMNLLELARLSDMRNVVFSSSATVYGDPDVLPVTEATECKPPSSPYGATKKICEDILRDLVASGCANGKSGCAKGECGNIRGIALRYFNPIGAHPSALIGEQPKGVPGNLVPYITQTAAGLRGELKIFGDDYGTPDGTALRDYIDIVDLARAHVHAVGRMLDGRQKSPYEVFNIGTGRPLSVMELVKTFERVNGLRLNYKIAPRRAGDIEAVWADTSLAERELGWRAERSLDRTLTAAWAWQKKC